MGPLEGDVATVGISKFAVDQLTDLIMIELPAVGTQLTAGKSFGEIESVKAVSDLYAPLAGEVIEVNSQVAGNVQLLAEDPYDKGWLIKIKVDSASRHVRLDGPRRLREQRSPRKVIDQPRNNLTLPIRSPEQSGSAISIDWINPDSVFLNWN